MNLTNEQREELTIKCEATDIAGREPMIRLLNQIGYTFEETERFNKVDIIFKDKKGATYHCEIKNRDEKYRKFDTHIIEIPKLEYLLSKERPIYCCIFGDYIYLYGKQALSKARTENMVRPKYNVINAGNNYSSCASVNSKYATIYYWSKEDNRYIKVNN